MKLVYEILYKNGKEDSISVELNEETKERLEGINEIFEGSMREDVSAVVTIGDGKTGGHIIRVSDVSRVEIKFVEA